ncbi:MAG: carbohydrate ABC transporter permease [Lachnospiraceae bacterium]|nr:carbohydrate ABC transporter permease [Lachnospiraceae bacterium]
MGKIIKNIILTLFALLEISPLIFLLSGSFMDNQEITGYISPVFNKDGGYATWGLVPSFPTLSNMAGVLLDSPEFFQMFWNTARITGLILAGQIVSGMPAAWGLARYQFKGRKVIYMVYIVMMMMPFQVTMLSQYLVLDNLGLLDTAAAVIIPGMFSTFPVFIMYRFFCGIPESIIEAARIDGAGEIQIFARLGIPLGSSGIISALVLSFLECFKVY